jgi:hypothetical protein
MVTSHTVMGVMQQFVYKESECLYSSVVTRHAEVKGAMQQTAYRLSCFKQNATWITD